MITNRILQPNDRPEISLIWCDATTDLTATIQALFRADNKDPLLLPTNMAHNVMVDTDMLDKVAHNVSGTYMVEMNMEQEPIRVILVSPIGVQTPLLQYIKPVDMAEVLTDSIEYEYVYKDGDVLNNTVDNIELNIKRLR